MAQQPRGRPPSQAPPPGARGRNALTFLGGGVLVLAVAGGALALFGRDEKTSETARPGAGTSSTSPPVFGPVAPGKATKQATKPTPTSTNPVAAPAATESSSAAPSAAATTPAPAPSAKPPTAPPVATPPVTAPQQPGTVAKSDYTFKVARGDTLWSFTKQALADTGRPTTNANVAAYVAKLYQSNQSVVGSDPDLILPGQVIVWPAGL